METYAFCCQHVSMQACTSPAPGYALPRSHWVRKITPNHKHRGAYPAHPALQGQALLLTYLGLPDWPACSKPQWTSTASCHPNRHMLARVPCHLPQPLVPSGPLLWSSSHSGCHHGVLGPSVIGGTSVDTSVPTAALPGFHLSELMARPTRWPFGHSDSRPTGLLPSPGRPPQSLSDAYKWAPVHERMMHAPSIPLSLPPGAHATSPCQVLPLLPRSRLLSLGALLPKLGAKFRAQSSLPPGHLP